MARIRVLLIAPSLDILGGQAVQADRLLTCLGTEPAVRMAFHPINPRIGPLRQIKYVRTVTTFVLYVVSLMARVWRYDILHVFTASYYSYTLWSLPALFLAKLYGKKIVLNYRDGQAEDHLVHWRSALPTLRRMDRIIAPSEYLVDVFARYDLKAQSIFNIIDMSRFQYRKRSHLRPIFLHNRGMEPIYNIDCTLRAFKIIQERYADARLTLAHDGPSRPYLESLAQQLELRNTKFVGHVPHQHIAELYDESEIYLTSPDFDCMPGSLLECFASGLPVIATKAGGIPYIAEHERTALLIECGDHTALAESAFRLLRDPELVERLTANAYEECKRYSPLRIQKQWLQVYRELKGEPATCASTY